MHNTVLTADELLARLQRPERAESFSALFGQPCALVNLQGSTPSQLERLAPLGQLPCPVIALGTLPAGAEGLVDTVVADEAGARPLIGNITRSPMTAMTLVQLLRHNEGASINDGLLAESLAYATLQGGPEFQRFLAAKPAPVTGATPAAPAVLYQRQGKCLDICLNRPDKRNAFSTAMRDGLVEALYLLAEDDSIDHARIRGAGECFCVGGDLDEFGLVPDTATGHAIRSTRNAGRLISQLADRVECHVQRACIGAGIELPAFCQRIVASRDAYFQLPEIKLGLVPGAGGTVSVLRRIGRHRTAWMALSGKRINAAKALDWGLIDAIE